jgi:hypothetical protein
MDVSRSLLPGPDLRLPDLPVTPDLVAILVETSTVIARCPEGHTG